MDINVNKSRFTAQEGRALLAQQQRKPSKYRAKPQVVDGIRFASQREARRYGELKLLAHAGEISALVMQEPFEVQFNGIPCFTWLADFSYIRNRVRVIEDAKGVRTPVYRLKKKIIEAAYGFKIVEV